MKETNNNTPVTMAYKNGMLLGKYHECKITLEVAKQVVEERKKLTNYKVAPILVDIRDVKEVDRAARLYFSSPEGTELLSAVAILTESKFSIFLSNFFQSVNLKKSQFPIRMFNNEEAAILWLKEYI